jgi:uncharacterized protein HemX
VAKPKVKPKNARSKKKAVMLANTKQRPQKRITGAAAKVSAPLAIDENGTSGGSLRWLLIAVLAAGLGMVAVAMAPAAALPRSFAHALATRRIEMAIAGMAIAVGLGFSIVLAALLA